MAHTQQKCSIAISKYAISICFPQDLFSGILNFSLKFISWTLSTFAILVQLKCTPLICVMRKIVFLKCRPCCVVTFNSKVFFWLANPTFFSKSLNVRQIFGLTGNSIILTAYCDYAYCVFYTFVVINKYNKWRCKISYDSNLALLT